MSAILAARVSDFFETITPASVSRLGEIYTSDVYFKDPFNEVSGLEPVEKIFTHMYQVLDNPRFVMTSQVLDGTQCFLTWDFLFTFKNFSKTKVQTIRGATHLKFVTLPDGQERVSFHRDYWDAAEELYEKLPGVGVLMRGLKRLAL